MIHKYIIFMTYIGQDDSKLDKAKDNIKKIFPVYCFKDTWALVKTESEDDTDILRDKIIKDASGVSICIFEVFTNNRGAANGIYASNDNWPWLSKFFKDDIKEIKEKVIEEIKNKENKVKYIPNAQINYINVGVSP